MKKNESAGKSCLEGWHEPVDQARNSRPEVMVHGLSNPVMLQLHRVQNLLLPRAEEGVQSSAHVPARLDSAGSLAIPQTSRELKA